MKTEFLNKKGYETGNLAFHLMIIPKSKIRTDNFEHVCIYNASREKRLFNFKSNNSSILVGDNHFTKINILLVKGLKHIYFKKPFIFFNPFLKSVISNHILFI